MIPAALLARTQRPSALSVATARATTHRGSAPVDLALVATAAADAWAHGNGLPRPRPYLAGRILAACKRVGTRHHIFVDSDHHARAASALTRMAAAINALPAASRAAVLCATLLDLLNDRSESEFAALSDALARLDRECPRAEGDEGRASALADAIREELGR